MSPALLVGLVSGTLCLSGKEIGEETDLVKPSHHIASY